MRFYRGSSKGLSMSILERGGQWKAVEVNAIVKNLLELPAVNTLSKQS